jgi:hypothetical protein
MPDQRKCFVDQNARRPTRPLIDMGRRRQFVFSGVLRVAQVFTRSSGSFAFRERGLLAESDHMPHRRCVDAPRKDTGSGSDQEFVTVLVDDPVRRSTAAGPCRTAHRITVFWRARCSGHRCRRLDLSVVSHELGKRDFIFAHLGDYFSEDNFGLALSSDVQLILKRFALREQFFKSGHFRLHYKKSFFEVVWMFDSVLINKGKRRSDRVLITGHRCVSAGLVAQRTGRTCWTDGCRTKGIPACELRRGFQWLSRRERRHAVSAGDERGVACTQGWFPTGLFAETVPSVRASRRVASKTATSRGNKIQIPRPAQLIQTLILTISYTRRQTLNRVKQFVRGHSDWLKNVDSQTRDLSVCRVQRIAGAIRARQYSGPFHASDPP